MTSLSIKDRLICLYNFELKLIKPFQDIFLLLIRLYWGWGFFQTGLGKFRNMPDVVEFFTKLGIPYPEINVYMAASTEMIGGLCLLAGLGSRIVTIPLCFTMVVAYLTAHYESVQKLFEDPNMFLTQEPFLFLLAALIVLLFGAGRVSVDYLIGAIFHRK